MWWTILVVVLQGFLAASPYYLQHEGVVDLSQPCAFYALLTALVGIDVVLITALCSFLVSSRSLGSFARRLGTSQTVSVRLL